MKHKVRLYPDIPSAWQRKVWLELLDIMLDPLRVRVCIPVGVSWAEFRRLLPGLHLIPVGETIASLSK
jgi:hypothetical protein